MVNYIFASKVLQDDLQKGENEWISHFYTIICSLMEDDLKQKRITRARKIREGLVGTSKLRQIRLQQSSGSLKPRNG